MAMELFVIMALDKLPNTDELNVLASDNTIPIVYHSNTELRQHTGYLPAVLNKTKSGVEIYTTPYKEASNYFPSFDNAKYKEPIVVTFRWGGNFQEMTVALSTAYLLTEGYDATTFEPQGGSFLSADDLKKSALSLLNNPM